MIKTEPLGREIGILSLLSLWEVTKRAEAFPSTSAVFPTGYSFSFMQNICAGLGERYDLLAVILCFGNTNMHEHLLHVSFSK